MNCTINLRAKSKSSKANEFNFRLSTSVYLNLKYALYSHVIVNFIALVLIIPCFILFFFSRTASLFHLTFPLAAYKSFLHLFPATISSLFTVSINSHSRFRNSLALYGFFHLHSFLYYSNFWLWVTERHHRHNTRDVRSFIQKAPSGTYIFPVNGGKEKDII